MLVIAALVMTMRRSACKVKLLLLVQLIAAPELIVISPGSVPPEVVVTVKLPVFKKSEISVAPMVFAVTDPTAPV